MKKDSLKMLGLSQAQLNRETNPFGSTSLKSKKKRKTLTPSQRIFFWEHPQLGGEVSVHCNDSNTKITLAVNSVAEGDSGELIGAHVECNCGIDCAYAITYQLKKVSNNWVIESESQMALA